MNRLSDEHRAAISLGLKGKRKSETHIRKMKGRNLFVKNNPMRNPVSLEKVISKKRGVPRPYMKRGIDGKYIGR